MCKVLSTDSDPENISKKCQLFMLLPIEALMSDTEIILTRRGLHSAWG